jgi:hypothetical protein
MGKNIVELILIVLLQISVVLCIFVYASVISDCDCKGVVSAYWVMRLLGSIKRPSASSPRSPTLDTIKIQGKQQPVQQNTIDYFGSENVKVLIEILHDIAALPA